MQLSAHGAAPQAHPAGPSCVPGRAEPRPVADPCAGTGWCWLSPGAPAAPASSPPPAPGCTGCSCPAFLPAGGEGERAAGKRPGFRGALLSAPHRRPARRPPPGAPSSCLHPPPARGPQSRACHPHRGPPSPAYVSPTPAGGPPVPRLPRPHPRFGLQSRACPAHTCAAASSSCTRACSKAFSCCSSHSSSWLGRCSMAWRSFSVCLRSTLQSSSAFMRLCLSRSI